MRARGLFAMTFLLGYMSMTAGALLFDLRTGLLVGGGGAMLASVVPFVIGGRR